MVINFILFYLFIFAFTASQDNILQAGDEDVQYSFRNGDQMMSYRVVQVGEDTDQIMTTQGNGQFYVISNPAPEFVSTPHKAIIPKATQNSNVRTPAPSIKKVWFCFFFFCKHIFILLF